jgi:molecular chaperone HtpG
MEYRFQVNLKDVIGILSHHLYSTPDVFLRELTQNCCDAILARQQADAAFQPQVQFELIPGDQPVLVVEDNGCGLTHDEIHEFLATIGTSSKRLESEFIEARSDFIGQFGIGLLSTFMVCDEIVVHTRSYKSDQAYEWRGRGDGTYELSESAAELSVGTRVFIRCAPGQERFFEREYVLDRLRHFCSFLPIPIQFTADDSEHAINREAPWRMELPLARREELALDLARTHFGDGEVLDVFPVDGDFVGGHAFLVPGSMLGGARRNVVYIRNMFVGANLSDLLPEWACLFGIILNSDHLTPSASREALYDDAHLAAARAEIERALNVYLHRLGEQRPHVLERLIAEYETLLKNIAVQNEQFLQHIAPFLTFETNRGRLALRDILGVSVDCVYYVSDVDEFHKVAPIATASGRLVINAGYSFEPSLLQLLRDTGTNKLAPLDGDSLLACIESVPDDQQLWGELLAALSEALAPHALRPRLCRFEPVAIPMLYFEDEAQRERRRLKSYRDEADDLFRSVLDDVVPDADPCDLLVNLNNPLVRALAQQAGTAGCAAAAQLLYVQSLLMGRYPLGQQELTILNENLGALLERAFAADGAGGR